jgi:hypothetical protein
MTTVKDEIAAATAEHARADGKASILLTSASIATSVLAGKHGGALPIGAWVLAGLCALATVFPRVRTARTGMAAYATLTPAQAVDRVETATELDRGELLVAMSRLGVRKYRLVQVAFLVTGVALVLSVWSAIG